MTINRRSDLMYQIQRRVGYAGAAACAAISMLNLVAISARGVALREAVIDPAIFLLPLFSLFSYLTTLRDWRLFRVLQVSVFLGYSYIASIAIEPGSLHGALFGIYGLVLGMQYGMLQKRFWLKISLLSLSYAAIRMVSAARYDEFMFHAAPAVAVLVALFVYLFWIVFAEEIRAYSHENSYLKAERDKNQVFVKFGQNISGVVHNLKSTLMSVDGCIDVLRLADERGREELLHIQKSSTTKMIEMINNFMTAVRSYQRTTLETVSLNQLVESSIEVLKGNRTLKHKLKIDLDLGTPDTVRGVPMEIMQVIDNLVTNSAEAMSATGRYRLVVRTRMADGLVSLSIIDEGVGIARCANCEGTVCLSCDHFAYGKSTKREGVGIGMMYVRQIVSEMKGTMRIESLPGSGTSVHLFFPCVPVASADPVYDRVEDRTAGV